MSEVSCKNCGRKIRSDIKCCPYCCTKNKQRNVKATISLSLGIFSLYFAFSYLMNVIMSEKLNLVFDTFQNICFVSTILFIAIIGMVLGILSLKLVVKRGKVGVILNVLGVLTSVIVIVKSILL